MEVSQASAQLMLFAEASRSHAKTSAMRAKVQDLPGNARDYGESTPVLLAKLDPATSSWKTSQLCLVEGLATFSETWPRSGMMRSGIAYQLPPLVCPTLGTAHGLLPTLGKNEGNGSSSKRFRGSTEYRGAKMSEGLRNSQADPIYTDPDFACAVMGFPKNWARLETLSSRKSPKSSDAQSRKRKE